MFVDYGMQKACDLLLTSCWVTGPGDRRRVIEQAALDSGRKVFPLRNDTASQSSENLLLFVTGFGLPATIVRPIRCEGASLVLPGRKGEAATCCRHVADTNIAPTAAAAVIDKSASQPNGVNTD